MIAKLTGTTDEIKPTEIILDVHGVGYHLTIPLPTYEKIQNQKNVSLYVYTLHREDQFKLYGFYTEQEKRFFSILIDISGIGPSMAISIISGIPVQLLIDAVQTENSALLVKIPGIGKSKAEKLIFELKRKMKKIEEFIGVESDISSPSGDAIEALVSLGFDESQSIRIVNDLLKTDDSYSVEEIIKESLKRLSG